MCSADFNYVNCCISSHSASLRFVEINELYNKVLGNLKHRTKWTCLYVCPLSAAATALSHPCVLRCGLAVYTPAQSGWQIETARDSGYISAKPHLFVPSLTRPCCTMFACDRWKKSLGLHSNHFPHRSPSSSGSTSSNFWASPRQVALAIRLSRIYVSCVILMGCS